MNVTDITFRFLVFYVIKEKIKTIRKIIADFT